MHSLSHKKLNLEILPSNKFSDIDVVCITEHWLNEHELEYCNIPHYKLISKFCRKEMIHGGSCIFVKSTLQAKPFTKFENIYVEEIFEASMIELTFPKLIKICIYRTPKSNTIVFTDKLDHILRELTHQKKKIIIVGDLNINFFSRKY